MAEQRAIGFAKIKWHEEGVVAEVHGHGGRAVLAAPNLC